MRNSKFWQILFYISSYLPLYLIVIIFNLYQDKSIVLYLGLAIVSIIILLRFFVLKNGEQIELRKYVVTVASDKWQSYYYSVYIILSIVLGRNTEYMIVLIAYLIVIGIIVVNVNMTYLSPFISIIGYKIFELIIDDRVCFFVTRMTFDELYTSIKRGDKVIRYKLVDNIYLIKR